MIVRLSDHRTYDRHIINSGRPIRVLANPVDIQVVKKNSVVTQSAFTSGPYKPPAD
jgi:hypothetical protein